MTRYQALLQPFQLKHLMLRNRIMSTSHEPAYSEQGRPGLRYRLYHEEKAKGGIALGGSGVVAPESPPAFGNLHLFDERIVADLRALADWRARPRRGGQITHLGRRTYWNRADWLPVLAPSPVREPAQRSFPKAMEDHGIRRTVHAYGAAARRCCEGGMDGIEIEAYGHLLDARGGAGRRRAGPSGPRRPARRPSPEQRQQSGRRLSAVPRGRRRCQSQHPRCHL
jgi:N-methyl-L-proline demethylase